jgi:hypothetical protein
LLGAFAVVAGRAEQARRLNESDTLNRIANQKMILPARAARPCIR